MVNDSRLAWLRFFIIGYILFWLIIFHNFMLLQIFHMFFWCPFGGSLLCLLPFMFFNIITLIALIKPDMILKSNKNGSSPLPESFMNRYRVKLISFMENEKPYLIPTISLGDLAEKTSISPRLLSHIINNSFNQHFFDFINSYRIKESQQMMMDPSNRRKTVLEVLYDVGFNSKSSFNTAFKKHVGMTTTQFKKQYFN